MKTKICPICGAGKLKKQVGTESFKYKGETKKIPNYVIPSGAPDHVVRTVTENSRTLKFTSQEFEKE